MKYTFLPLLKTSAVVVALPAALIAGWVGCSTDDPSSPSATDAGIEAAPPPPPDAVADQGVADAGITCPPQPLATQPQWRPPRTPGQDACTQAQIDGYVKACIASGGPACDNYRQDAGTCFSCIDSTDTDPTRGPIVWRHNRNTYWLNVGGCLALAEGDLSDASCGATDQLAEDCHDLACTACPGAGKAGYDELMACEKQTKTVCASYDTSFDVKCAPEWTPDASAATKECIRTDKTFDALILQYANYFCTSGAGDAGDAGDADAGD